MTKGERAALVIDVKPRGGGVAVIMRVERGGRKVTATPAELQARLDEHGLTWPAFVSGVNDFERWLQRPSNRQSCPEYVDDRLELLRQLKAKLNLEGPRAPGCAPAPALVANREPKKSVMRPRKMHNAFAEALKSFTHEVTTNPDGTMSGNEVCNLLRNAGEKLRD